MDCGTISLDSEDKTMDYRQIKKQANEILKNKTAECSYIEYKASEKQLDKLLKTICAYGNNYYNNDIQYIFIGVEEENNDEQKAIPVLPIKGLLKEDWKNVRTPLTHYVLFYILMLRLRQCRITLKELAIY